MNLSAKENRITDVKNKLMVMGGREGLRGRKRDKLEN